MLRYGCASSWRVAALLTTAVQRLLQYERREAGALTKVLDKHELHALFPLVALEAGLPSVLQVLHLLPPLNPSQVRCVCHTCLHTADSGCQHMAFSRSVTLPPVLAAVCRSKVLRVSSSGFTSTLT